MSATLEQVLDWYTRDARPDVRVRVEFGSRLLATCRGCIAFVVAHGSGEMIAAVDAAGTLAYGSVIFVADVSEDEYAAAHAALTKNNFRAWDKFGTEHGHAWVKSLGDLGYGSHVSYLVAAVARTEGPVLELGSGFGSTEVLHEICAAQKRQLVTVDNVGEWLANFFDLAGPGHAVTLAKDVNEYARLIADQYQRWGVVFIDHAPGESRRDAVEIFRDRADYVACHDSEELGYNLEDALSTFKYRRDFRRHRPWTTIASMTKPVW